jgi:hypothetical protein
VSSFLEQGPATIYEPVVSGPPAALPGTFAAFGTSALPEDPVPTVGGAAWVDAAELADVVGATFPDLDSAAAAAQQHLGAALAGGDGAPRLRRDPVAGDVGVLVAHTNVPDDSVVEMYYFIAVRRVTGGVEVTAAQRAALGRDATICGSAAVPCV